ncbi:hypothetical protein MP228_005433 [Amoeboaphelidium protococcarum]|nr:hypothetical protein MP228_005433 [Amoeboaphelidium protococcarum]
MVSFWYITVTLLLPQLIFSVQNRYYGLDMSTGVKVSSDGSVWMSGSKGGLYALYNFSPASQSAIRTITFGQGSGNVLSALSIDSATQEIYAVGS